jgi:hypothetical protein
MVSVNEIKPRLREVIDGGKSLDDFEDWLASASWNMHQQDSEAAQGLAAAIELRLAEYSSKHLDPEGLRSELLALMGLVPADSTVTASSHSGQSRVISRYVFSFGGAVSTASVPSARSSTEKHQLLPLGGAA